MLRDLRRAGSWERYGPTWLMFLFFTVASFAPAAMGIRPGRWVPYYFGALLLGWVLVSVAAMRRVAREDQKPTRRLFSAVVQRHDVKNTKTAQTQADVRVPLTEERLIIVARDEPALYHLIDRSHVGDNSVRVITDRRSTDRRRQLEVYIPDRRCGERRRRNIDPTLLAAGWAEVTSPKG
jgi:hypothetical protein